MYVSELWSWAAVIMDKLVKLMGAVPRNQRHDDDLVDRLHHFYTVTIIVSTSDWLIHCHTVTNILMDGWLVIDWLIEWLESVRIIPYDLLLTWLID